MSNPSKPRFFYVYDALCGWCYGFSPVMKRFYEAHQSDFEFTVVSGGMVMGERSGPIGQVAGYIKTAYKKVEEHTGVKFGQAFLEGMLEEGTANFSSLQPAVALSVFRNFKQDLQVPYAHDLQHMIYHDGIAPDDIVHYGRIASKYGIPEGEFHKGMADEEYIKRAFTDFETSRKLEVTGFPAAFVYHNETFFMVARGYCDYETLEMRVNRVLETPVA